MRKLVSKQRHELKDPNILSSKYGLIILIMVGTCLNCSPVSGFYADNPDESCPPSSCQVSSGECWETVTSYTKIGARLAKNRLIDVAVECFIRAANSVQDERS